MLAGVLLVITGAIAPALGVPQASAGELPPTKGPYW